MSQRVEFVVDWQREMFTMSELCARYGISRKTGYKWLERFEAEGIDGLKERSRAPRQVPHRTPERVEEAVLDLRRKHPSWGPRKLLGYLRGRRPNWPWPAASTVGEMLKRHGLSEPRKRRRKVGHPGRPTTVSQAPNAMWTADYKGQFRTGDRRYCYPLTVADDYSRYVLGCRALLDTKTRHARPAFERLFREYGLPDVIKTDNGVPFATNALLRLSRLQVWWIKLGIRPELTRPSNPQDNGRHERMHRTLKWETTRPPAANAKAQQAAFDRFMRVFNEERPHEALELATPASVYRPSPRPYPAKVCSPEYPVHFEVRRVSRNGGIRWQHDWVNVSTCLMEEYVGLEEIDDGIWSMYFGPILLGRFDERERLLYGAHCL